MRVRITRFVPMCNVGTTRSYASEVESYNKNNNKKKKKIENIIIIKIYDFE